MPFLLALALVLAFVQAPQEAVVARVNQVRADVNLPPLPLDSRLNTAAQRHADDMARSGVFSHTGSDGSTPPQRIQAAGYPLTSATGETIAYHWSPNPADVVALWQDSPPHLAILRGAAYAHAGVGIAADQEGRVYVVLTVAGGA